jgi:hypothetical protein
MAELSQRTSGTIVRNTDSNFSGNAEDVTSACVSGHPAVKL